ncbi:hypothetical protein GWI33_021353 [Rhynchophorus ferrugineus]|uniref:Uncharacterized protein n=1 Tax=Rhynchophorus ferrugineus TaxID=354439 RepID=A0A834HPS1_RHYFE|nr:hypothetical protein GWI33_021353 [Rhynchophorus ferrugineus]
MTQISSHQIGSPLKIHLKQLEKFPAAPLPFVKNPPRPVHQHVPPPLLPVVSYRPYSPSTSTISHLFSTRALLLTRHPAWPFNL